MKKPIAANKVNRPNSASTCIKDSDTDELIDSITYTKRPTETISIQSSQEMESDCPLNNPFSNPSYLLDRDSCQMSPLLFESDTDDECSPLKCGQGTPTLATTKYNINPGSPTHPPDNVEYFQIFSGLYNLSSRLKNKSGVEIKKSSSEPIMVLESLNRLSDKTTSEEEVILPRRISRKITPKQEPVEDELNTPRVTRSLVRNEQIATRSKVKTGQINLSNRKALILRKKRSPAPSKSPHKKSFKPSSLVDDTSLDTPPSASVKNVMTTLDPDETEMIVLPETIPTIPCTKYDFNISVGLPQKRRNSSVSTDLEIISQKHVFVSLTSSSECPASGCAKPNNKFAGTALRESPDMFYSGDEDIKTPSTVMRVPFFSKPKPKFFEGLLETSTPVKWSQPLSDSSQDIFWDTSSTLGAVSPSRLRPQLTKRQVDAIADDEPKSDVFEITKNDVFSNMIRVTSDSDMSPMRVSEDEEPIVAAAEVEVTTPKRRPSCLDGLTIEKRCKPSTTSTDDISLDFTTAAPIEVSSSDMDCLPSSADLLERTPKRTKLPKTIGRRWWSTPKKKTTKARKKRTISSSSSSVVNPPDIRRWFKKSKDEESPKKASRQRRLDLWFKTDSSPKVTPTKLGLITLSSDEDS